MEKLKFYFGDPLKVLTLLMQRPFVPQLVHCLSKAATRSWESSSVICKSLHFMSTCVWAWWSSFFTRFRQCMPFRIASSSPYYGLLSDVRWITKREGYEGYYTVGCFLQKEIFTRTFLVFDSNSLFEYFERFLRCAVLSPYHKVQTRITQRLLQHL